MTHRLSAVGVTTGASAVSVVVGAVTTVTTGASAVSVVVGAVATVTTGASAVSVVVGAVASVATGASVTVVVVGGRSIGPVGSSASSTALMLMRLRPPWWLAARKNCTTVYSPLSNRSVHRLIPASFRA
jgi:hypothetical protein